MFLHIILHYINCKSTEVSTWMLSWVSNSSITHHSGTKGSSDPSWVSSDAFNLNSLHCYTLIVMKACLSCFISIDFKLVSPVILLNKVITFSQWHSQWSRVMIGYYSCQMLYLFQSEWPWPDSGSSAWNTECWHIRFLWVDPLCRRHTIPRARSIRFTISLSLRGTAV